MTAQPRYFPNGETVPDREDSAREIRTRIQRYAKHFGTDDAISVAVGEVRKLQLRSQPRVSPGRLDR